MSSVSDWLKPVAGALGWMAEREVEGTMTEGVAWVTLRAIGEAGEEVCIDIGIVGP